MIGRDVQEILKQPYTRVLTPDVEDGGYVASILEFPGVFGQGETADEAIAHVNEVAEDWLAAAIESGHDIPTPLDIQEFSGRMIVRMSPSVHRDIKLWSELEGVSMNQWINDAITERLGGVKTLERYLKQVLANLDPHDASWARMFVTGPKRTREKV